MSAKLVELKYAGVICPNSTFRGFSLFDLDVLCSFEPIRN